MKQITKNIIRLYIITIERQYTYFRLVNITAHKLIFLFFLSPIIIIILFVAIFFLFLSIQIFVLFLGGKEKSITFFFLYCFGGLSQWQKSLRFNCYLIECVCNSSHNSYKTRSKSVQLFDSNGNFIHFD